MKIPGFDRITVDPAKMNGQPCIRDMRLTVSRVLKAIALYPERTELFKAFPELEEDDIRQSLEFAGAAIAEDIRELKAA
jgi:uncharacterized protein (DUF433 family)